jgi:taurine dioxygenase
MSSDSANISFEVVPTGAPVGAEVTGLDLRYPIPESILRKLRPALFEHILLLFRGQDLTTEQQHAFCAQFGALYLTKNKQSPTGELRPEMRLVSNREEHRSGVAQLHDSDMTFHHDTIFRPLPQMALCMHAMEVPTYGGNTFFNNMYAAYDALPRDVKERIKGLTCLNAYAYTQTERLDLSKDPSKGEQAVHPVAITHPSTGRKALYVNRLMSMHINGLPEPESAELLEFLFAHAEKREFSYEHRWRKGDTVIWDNLASIHARTDIPRDQKRVMRHTSLAGIKAPEFA